jgi:hypothetical protein
MDKLNQKRQNLGRVFNSRCGHSCILAPPITKTAKLKVENSARTTLMFSPVSFRFPLSPDGSKFPSLYFVKKNERNVDSSVTNRAKRKKKTIENWNPEILSIF